MTSDTDKLKQWHVIAKLGELERMYMLGNPMALYEVVMTCNRLNTRIPDWAAEPIKVALAGYYTGEKSWPRPLTLSIWVRGVGGRLSSPSRKN